MSYLCHLPTGYNVNMQHNYANMRLIYVNIQIIYTDMQIKFFCDFTLVTCQHLLFFDIDMLHIDRKIRCMLT